MIRHLQIGVLALLTWGAAALPAQMLNLQHLDRLAERTSDSVNVTLDGNLLKMATNFLSDNDKDAAQLKQVVAGVQGIYVRSFKFNRDGEYNQQDLNVIQDQLKGSDWSRVVDIREGASKQVVTVYLRSAGKQLGGMAIVAAAPRELTVVNIVGNIDLEKLEKLSGQLGIPQISVQRNRNRNSTATPKAKDKEDE